MLQRLLELRPFAFHTCGELNFASIRRARALRSAKDLIFGTAYEHLLSVRRAKSVVAQLSDGPVEIRDNLPLRLGSLEIEPNVTLEQFLQELNGRVYLWPGGERGPIGTGAAHFQHYQGEGEVRVIRVPLQDLLQVNANRTLSVTYCNAGSARHHSGRRAIRGPGTFQSIDRTTRTMGEVKELTFVGSVLLPGTTAWARTPSGPWLSL